MCFLNTDDNYSSKFATMVSMMVALISFIILYNLLFTSTQNEPIPCFSTNTTIYSLSLNSETEGSGFFVLGIGGGSIREEIYYYFYEYDSGGIILSNSIASTTIIKEDISNQTTPYIERKDKIACGDDYRWILHVPEGTIKQKFNADTQNIG